MLPRIRLTLARVTALGVVMVAPTAAQTPGGVPAQPMNPGLANARPTFLAHVGVDHINGVYREGQTIAVRFAAERAAHLYLLYQQADGRSLLLFPNPAHPNNKIPARQVVEVPAPGEPFRFRVRPPFGDEVLQVLATAEPAADLDALAAQTQRRAAAVPPELLTQLSHRLAQSPAPWAEHRVPIHTLPATAPTSALPPARVGLFVGIGKYLHPEIGATHNELRHSAEVMHEGMLKRGALDPARTRLLIDQQATRANIEESITRWLPSVTQPGDTVFVYFSGHAGQAPCPDGSEPDGQDEMLGPYDLEAGTPGMTLEARKARFRDSSIVDDVLARWLEGLAGRHVVLILDTCHSGGVVEGKGLERAFADEAARVKDIAQMNVVVLTSCAADEQSLFEGTPNGTMWFTYFLAESLEKLPRPVTVQAAFGYAKQGLKAMLRKRREARDQEPTLNDPALLPVELVP